MGAPRPTRPSGPAASRLDEAAALLQRGRFMDAQRAAEAALAAVSPGDRTGAAAAPARELLAACLAQRGRFDEAAEHLEQVAAVRGDDPAVAHRLGMALMYAGRFDEAAAALGRAIEHDSGHAAARRALAELALKRGDADAARATLAPLLAAAPIAAETHLLAAQLALAARDLDAADAAVETGLRTPSVTPPARRQLLFARGRIADRRGEHAAAWTAWTDANRTTPASGRPWDAAAHAAETDAVIAGFDGEPAAAASSADGGTATTAAASPPRRPILVVGLPRSGSTLVEQIIDAHPQAFGTGETAALPTVLGGLARAHANRRRFPDWWSDVPAAARTEAGTAYRTALEDRMHRGIDRAPITHLVDKNLLNLPWAGAALDLCPDARIVVCRRDPIENGLSCFMNDLSPTGFPWAGDLESIAAFTVQAERLIAHWAATLGDRVLLVDHEDLVEDPGAWTRRIVDFCDLPWDDACSRPHETGRAVTTLSLEQVREPINRRAFGRARHYAEQLAPLERALTAAGATRRRQGG